MLDTTERKSKCSSLPSTDTSNTIAGKVQNRESKVSADPSSPDSLKGDDVISLGQYQVIEVLGQGGMGVVFLAFDSGLRRHAAIKVLKPEFASNSLFRRRFTREAQLAASVIHENVVTVYAVEESADFAYLVMEYVDGLSLQDKLDRQGGLPAREIVEIGIQVAEGLAAAHARGMIHRDIKPANVLLNKATMQAKLADFGLARPVDDCSLTQQGAMVGTPAYMSPEQVRQETLDARTDLFSLGGVLYAMCSGEPPFGMEQTFKVLQYICDEDPPSLRYGKAKIPNDLIAVVEKLLAKKPEDRIQSAGEVAKQLRRQLLFMA
jgi:serine/threonine protein kinase